MHRFIMTLLALSTTLAVSASMVYAGLSLRDDLTERFRLSHIEVHKGTVLRLQADRVPANVLRTVQLNTKSPRFHVRVEVGRDGRITTGPGVVSLTTGTGLVVLDLEVSGERVRLFTPTLDPVALPDGTVGHGCTEFVFAFDPGSRDRADLGTIAGRIDQVLTRNANG